MWYNANKHLCCYPFTLKHKQSLYAWQKRVFFFSNKFSRQGDDGEDESEDRTDQWQGDKLSFDFALSLLNLPTVTS